MTNNSAPTIRIPPIIINASDWFKAAPSILNAINHVPQAKILADDRTLKVVIKGIPTDISEDDISNELISLGFDIKIVKRFGNKSKPLPICLISLSKNPSTSEIYELLHLFYLSVKVETYKKSGPAQCFSCQRNCVNPAGRVLYRHAQNSDYVVTAPSSPTHFPANPVHRPDILDVALHKLPLHLVEVFNLNELSSDHNPILLTTSDSPVTALPPHTCRTINWLKYANTLEKSTLNLNVQTDTLGKIDTAFQYLSNTIASTVESCSYVPTSRHNHQIPNEILVEIASKNRIRRTWQQTRDPATKRQFNGKIKFIRTHLQTHRQDEWDEFLNSLNINDNSIFKLNKKLLNKTPATHPLSGPNSLLYNAKDKAELFASTYENQFTENPGPSIPAVVNFAQSIRIAPSPDYLTSPDTVQKIIKNLPKRKAPGIDHISNTAIQFLPKSVVLLLTRIFNECMRIGYFPKSWKRAVIITIPKPGKDHRHPTNYSPISLLSSLSKVFEKVILTKLNAVIGPQIRPEQFAFRSHHSTTNRVGLIERLSVNKENKQRTVAIFLDIEKAFDRLWHPGLLYKLYLLNTPALVKSLLEDRSFIVRVENEISSAKPIRAGVPQSSCLSPLLYSAYTNDIPLNSNATLSLFADDTLLTTTNRNPSSAKNRLT
ncbi:hypothetical protein QTP88_008059 [Uroleucon formosanum]